VRNCEFISVLRVCVCDVFGVYVSITLCVLCL